MKPGFSGFSSTGTFFYKIVNMLISTIIPSIGDVFEQSLYKNHSNAENLACCFGNALGALACFAVGDFIKWHPWLIFTLVFLDWLSFWSRWQFYFNKFNFAVIKRNFAKDSGEKLREQRKQNRD